jgi:hypothetical protein
MPWTYSSREPSSGAIVACFLIIDLVDVGSGSDDCGRVVGQPECAGINRHEGVSSGKLVHSVRIISPG